MNYVLQYFLSLASDDPYRCAELLFGNVSAPLNMDIAEDRYTHESCGSYPRDSYPGDKTQIKWQCSKYIDLCKINGL